MSLQLAVQEVPVQESHQLPMTRHSKKNTIVTDSFCAII